MGDLEIGGFTEASADVITAGDKILALHALIGEDVDDAEFRARVTDIIGPALFR